MKKNKKTDILTITVLFICGGTLSTTRTTVLNTGRTLITYIIIRITSEVQYDFEYNYHTYTRVNVDSEYNYYNRLQVKI